MVVWYDHHIKDHKCDANFEGSSSEMERQAVAEMFQASKDFGLRYQYLVGDGDSKSFLDVWDTYGICDHCEKVRDIISKRNGPEFEKWSATDDYKKWCKKHDEESEVSGDCFAVKKLECGQHVGKYNVNDE